MKSPRSQERGETCPTASKAVCFRKSSPRGRPPISGNLQAFLEFFFRLPVRYGLLRRDRAPPAPAPLPCRKPGASRFFPLPQALFSSRPLPALRLSTPRVPVLSGNDSLLFGLCVPLGARLPLRSPETARGTTPPACARSSFPASLPVLSFPCLFPRFRPHIARPKQGARTESYARALSPARPAPPPADFKAPTPLPDGKDDSLPRVAARTCAAVLTEQERCAAPAPSSLPRSCQSVLLVRFPRTKKLLRSSPGLSLPLCLPAPYPLSRGPFFPRASLFFPARTDTPEDPPRI